MLRGLRDPLEGQPGETHLAIESRSGGRYAAMASPWNGREGNTSDCQIPFGIRTRVLQILRDVTLAARISPDLPTKPHAPRRLPISRAQGGDRVVVRRETLLVPTGSTDLFQ